MKFFKAFIVVNFVFVLMLACTTFCEDALIDDNSKATQIVEDKDTAGTIIRLKGNPLTGALLVDGVGSASCDDRELVKYGVSAASDSSTNLYGTSTSTQALIANESVYDVYWNDQAVAATSTSMLISPREKVGLAQGDLRAIHIYNAGGATAQVTIMYCN